MTWEYAIVSCVEERGYRYRMDVRTGRKGQRALVIQLNPSTADSSKSDATIGKVSLWAAEKGFRSVTYTNLFAKRTPDPKKLRGSYSELTGTKNDSLLRDAVREADRIIVAWGNVPAGVNEHFERRCSVLRSILAGRAVHAVGEPTRQGLPRHGRMWNGTNRKLRIFTWANA